jgi:hypothetical protein
VKGGLRLPGGHPNTRAVPAVPHPQQQRQTEQEYGANNRKYGLGVTVPSRHQAMIL